MTTYYFIRHGQTDFSERKSKIYQGWGENMSTLSSEGIEQVKQTAEDSRLKDADIILSSPYGRALHTAAILSKELQLEIVIETDLHEWCANTDYIYLSQEKAMKNYEEFTAYKGVYPKEEMKEWESVDSINKRIYAVLKKYKHYKKVIVVCHGTLMQYFLSVPHPENGDICEWVH